MYFSNKNRRKRVFKTVFPSGHTSFYIFLIFHKNEEKKQKENLENSELQNGNLSYTYIKSSSFMFRISNSNHEKRSVKNCENKIVDVGVFFLIKNKHIEY